MSIIGALSVLPYIYFLGIIPKSTSLSLLIIKSIISAAIIYGIMCWASYNLLKRIDLKPFDNPVMIQIFPGIMWGIAVSIVIFLSDKLVFKKSILVSSSSQPPFWAGILSSLYGAINEEVFCRLFLLTLIYFILSKTVKRTNLLMWLSILCVALIFGLGHLPAAFKLIHVSSFEIMRILFLNGIAGTVFGWLYCSKGFWAAVIAHFTSDLFIHAFLISL
jgi:hypothetical protein